MTNKGRPIITYSLSRISSVTSLLKPGEYRPKTKSFEIKFVRRINSTTVKRLWVHKGGIFIGQTLDYRTK
jgi:hypothetical protein